MNHFALMMGDAGPDAERAQSALGTTELYAAVRTSAASDEAAASATLDRLLPAARLEEPFCTTRALRRATDLLSCVL